MTSQPPTGGHGPPRARKPKTKATGRLQGRQG
jgi:hypothetical protein